MTGSGAMRASDRDREATVAVLREAYAEGRLTLAELQARVQDAYTAVTWSQLDVLTADLPQVRQQAGEVVRLRAVSAASPAPGLLATAVLVSGLAWLGIVTGGWPLAVVVPVLAATLLVLAAAWWIHWRDSPRRSRF